MEKACRFMDEKNMKEEMEKIKNEKMRTMIKDGCELKEYVKHCTLYSARNMWEIRFFMLRVAGNFPSYKKYKSTGWRCQACPYMVREDQDLLTHCSGYAELRTGINFSSNEELVKFYRRVMMKREAGTRRS